MNRYCPKCFTELPNKANYCPTCGECMREQTVYESQIIGREARREVVGFRDKALMLGGSGNEPIK